jgi:hypothetical protein
VSVKAEATVEDRGQITSRRIAGCQLPIANFNSANGNRKLAMSKTLC